MHAYFFRLSPSVGYNYKEGYVVAASAAEATAQVEQIRTNASASGQGEYSFTRLECAGAFYKPTITFTNIKKGAQA